MVSRPCPPVPLAVKFVVHLPLQRLELLGVLQVALPRRGQPQRDGIPVKEGGPQLVLHLLYKAAQGGLGNIQRLGRLGKACGYWAMVLMYLKYR